MRYFLVDRIGEWKIGDSIKGIKNVAMSEDYLEFHFQRNPVMPGVLLLEALAQLAGWLEALSSDYQNWFLLQKVNKCHFYGFTLPGDRVELDVQLKSGISTSERKFSGLCTVNGKKKVVAEFEGETIPLAEIEDVDKQKEFFKILTRS